MSESKPEGQEQSLEHDSSETTPSKAEFKNERPKPQRRHSNLPSRGLEKRFSMRIPADFDAAHTAAETHGHDHWKVKLLHIVHSDLVQYTMMVLLVLDVAILCAELFLAAGYPACHIIERDAISCCPAATDMMTHEDIAAANVTGDEHFRRFLAETSGGHGDDHHSVCQYPAVESHEYEAGCDTHKWHVVHTVEQVLFAITVTILSLFMIELIIMMVALQKAFFNQFFYVLDFIIVFVSLVLEITFAVLHEELLVTLAGLLIFFRVWRFIRIGHGLIEVTAELQAKDKEVLLHYAELLEEKLLENKIDLPEKSRQLQRIEKRLTSHGASGHGSHKQSHEHAKSHEQEQDEPEKGSP